MNAISIAIPAHGRLKQSSEEISPAAWGETNAHAMLAAELAAINPKVAAGFQWTLGTERSPPLSVVLKVGLTV